MTLTHISFFFCNGGKFFFVKSQPGVATRVTFKKTLTRNLMDFCTRQKATPQKSLHLCRFAFKHNIPQPEQPFLYNVYKCNCEPLWLFGAIIVSQALLLFCSAILVCPECVGFFFYPLNKWNMRFWGVSLSLSRHTKKGKEKIGSKGEGVIGKFAVITGRVVGDCQLNVLASSSVIAVLLLSAQDEAGFRLERCS